MNPVIFQIVCAIAFVSTATALVQFFIGLERNKRLCDLERREYRLISDRDREIDQRREIGLERDGMRHERDDALETIERIQSAIDGDANE